MIKGGACQCRGKPFELHVEKVSIILEAGAVALVAGRSGI